MLIKKIILILAIIFIFSTCASALQELSAESYVVVDADCAQILVSKNENKKQSMASTTKIMTALLAIESGKLQCRVTASRNINVEGTSVGIHKGDIFSLETLVYAMILESGNDAAVLVAEYLAGSESSFAALMNSKARELGMKNTNFVTASGLDSREHYTTAYDMAILTCYAVKNPVFRSICSVKNYVAHYINPGITVNYINHNKLLNMYEGVFGVKTGFTKKSGRCLVSACEKNGRTLVAVTLRAPDDWNDHINLYDYCFNIPSDEIVDYSEKDSVFVVGGMKSKISLNYPKALKNVGAIDYEIFIPNIIYAPVIKGDIIGNVVIYSDEGVRTFYPIESADSVFAIDSDISDLRFKIRFFIYKLLKG